MKTQIRILSVLITICLSACGDDDPKPQNPTTTPTVTMLTIPSGTFEMGTLYFDSDERPVRKITLTKSFLLSKYEVTQELWKAVLGNNPSYFAGDSLPVENVTWFEAINFCNEFSKKQGLTPVYTIINDSNIQWNTNANGYRLPTEAEWEYSCRAGTTTDFYTGNFSRNLVDTSYDRAGWYCSNADNKTHKVGLKQPNNFGLYDMHGNVWEWVWDWFSFWPGNDTSDWVVSERVKRSEAVYYTRIQRGGSFHCEGTGHYGRSAHRHFFDPKTTSPSFGFRIARSIP